MPYGQNLDFVIFEKFPLSCPPPLPMEKESQLTGLDLAYPKV